VQKTQPWHECSNFCGLNLPFCSISYWSLFPESTAVAREGYDRGVDNPMLVTVAASTAAKAPAWSPPSETRSLYKLANELPQNYVPLER